MPIIDPNGLFTGSRLRQCSDKARLYWPYFFLASNGFGRLEIDYDALVVRLFLGFDEPPSEEEFTDMFVEYRGAFLIFLYEFKGAIWGQWAVPAKFLPRHKTTADRESPKPDQKLYDEWAKSYTPENNRLQKLSEKLGKFPRSVGVGVVGGEVGGAPLPPDFDLEGWWENLVAAYPKSTGKRMAWVHVQSQVGVIPPERLPDWCDHLKKLATIAQSCPQSKRTFLPSLESLILKHSEDALEDFENLIRGYCEEAGEPYRPAVTEQRSAKVAEMLAMEVA